MPICRLDTSDAGFEAKFQGILRAAALPDEALVASVHNIIRRVAERGDEAVLEYALEFDGSEAASVNCLRVSREDLQRASESVPAKVLDALRCARERIFQYAQRQKLEEWRFEEESGTTLGQLVRPIESVGLYVPGGKAAYPSSVLMSAVFAAVAGVPRIVMTTPPLQSGANPLLLAAAELCGLEEVWLLGGAQAIAALALGTQTIEPVHKIVGPGNAYVTEAKRQMSGFVGIDMPAGPSEILIICDAGAPVDWVVSDLLSQAEHDESARPMLLCPDRAYLDTVADALQVAVDRAPRAGIIRDSLAAHGLLLKVRDLDEAVGIANRIAPEHLEIFVADPERLLGTVHNAGAIFVGKYSSEVLGDYCAGPSHILPTGGAARFASPLGVYDFQKRSSFIHCSEAGASELGEIASCLAEAEGLFAHADAARRRVSAGQGSASG